MEKYLLMLNMKKMNVKNKFGGLLPETIQHIILADFINSLTTVLTMGYYLFCNLTHFHLHSNV